MKMTQPKWKIEDNKLVKEWTPDPKPEEWRGNLAELEANKTRLESDIAYRQTLLDDVNEKIAKWAELKILEKK